MPAPTYQVWVNSAQLPDADVLKIGISRQRSDIFDRLSVGEAQIEVMAQTGRYSVGSDRVIINQPVNIRAVDGTSVYNLFTGFVEGYDLDPAINANRRMTIKCGDIAGRLRNVIQTSLQYLVTQQAVFENVFAAAGISSAQYVLDGFPDAVVFSYADQVTAGDALANVQTSGAHYLYVDGAGRINAVNRNFDNVSTTAIASLSAVYGMALSTSDETVVNECNVRIAPRRIVFDVQTVGYLTDYVFIGGTSSATVTVEFTDPVTQERGVPVYALQPISASDYYISANPDLTGASLASQCVITVNQFARSANITVVNSGTSNAYLVQLTLRGTPATQGPEVKTTIPNSASQVTYQKRSQEFQADLLQTTARGANLAEYVIFRYAEPLNDLTVQVKNEWPYPYTLDINNHVWVQNSLLNVASSFVIKSVEHTIDFDAGAEHTLSMSLETRTIKGWFTLDSSTLGRLDINRLGF